MPHETLNTEVFEASPEQSIYDLKIENGGD